MNDITNKLIAENLSLLSLCNFDQYNYILSENTKFKADMNRLILDNNALYVENQRLHNVLQLLDMQYNKLQNDISKCRPKLNHTNSTVKHSNFMNTIFKPNRFSFDKENTDTLIENIKDIDDIINLAPMWKNIRHDQILNKLQYLAPVLIKLNNMIGLKDIKNEFFKKIIYYVKNPHNNEYLHTIFTGPPGVGKTEIAKLYAQLFVRLGILKTDNFIEIKRTDLVGEYLGQTAPKTKELLESAMGGVLFLDEAYSLGSSGKEDSYSKEAIDMINQYLSERKGEFMFIIAGYEDDIENCLLAHNKGMKRRFQSHYKINGYNAEEMVEIFLQKIKQLNYTTDISRNKLIEFFKENLSSFKYFGGDVEKLVNEIKYIQCVRIFNQNIDSKNIIFSDIEKAFTKLNIKNDDSHLSLYA
jgi:SpoVK/Ycf46/Vps4 family AAA+-type ATPase